MKLVHILTESKTAKFRFAKEWGDGHTLPVHRDTEAVLIPITLDDDEIAILKELVGMIGDEANDGYVSYVLKGNPEIAGKLDKVFEEVSYQITKYIKRKFKTKPTTLFTKPLPGFKSRVIIMLIGMFIK